MKYDNLDLANFDKRAKAITINVLSFIFSAMILSEVTQSPMLPLPLLVIAIVVFSFLKTSPGAYSMNIFLVKNDEAEAGFKDRLIRNFTTIAYPFSVFTILPLARSIGHQESLWKDALALLLFLIMAGILVLGYLNFSKMFNSPTKQSYLDEKLGIKVMVIPRIKKLRTDWRS